MIITPTDPRSVGHTNTQKVCAMCLHCFWCRTARNRLIETRSFHTIWSHGNIYEHVSLEFWLLYNICIFYIYVIYMFYTYMHTHIWKDTKQKIILVCTCNIHVGKIVDSKFNHLLPIAKMQESSGKSRTSLIRSFLSLFKNGKKHWKIPS